MKNYYRSQILRLFLQALWAQLDLPSPTRANMLSQTIFNMDLSVFRYKLSVVLENPGSLEHSFFGRFFNNPEKKIMIISASKERADNMSIFLQKLIIETPWLSFTTESDDARWSRISFDVNCSPHQAPSVKSVGITGQLTGSRAI